MGGRIRTYDMDEWSRFEIDSPEDAELLEWVVRRPEFRMTPTLPETIDLVVFDFDGVMTDNKLLVDETGRESVRVNRADGLGLDGLRAAGVRAMILSTEKNPVVAARAKKLQLEAVHGIADKGARLSQILREDGLDPANVIYVGNDLNDLGCFGLVGCPVAVADAHPDIRTRARITLNARGGEGAVRELCDMIIARSSPRTP